MCHQSVGLIAREIEGRGIPTVGLSSALSITEAARQPRAVYLDFPLGHTAGRPHDAASQRAVLESALDLLASAERPETIRRLSQAWRADDAWKDAVMRVPAAGEAGHDALDTRTERFDTPQYQTAADARAAARAPDCPTCVYP